jgi:hypothetical protein
MLLIDSITSFIFCAESSNASLSSPSKGTAIVDKTPCLPITAGMLRQQPKESCQKLTGRTWRRSNKIDSQRMETTAAIPKEVAPLALMISYAFSLTAAAMICRRSCVRGNTVWMWTPPIAAEDHATCTAFNQLSDLMAKAKLTNCESPCSPRTYAWTDLSETYLRS